MFSGVQYVWQPVALVYLLFVAGCSRHVVTFPVSGQVRFDDGQPVPHGIIEFRSEQTGVSARAKLDSAGHFVLGTFTLDDGAPAGKYRVVIVQHFDIPPQTHVHTHADEVADDHSQIGHDAEKHVALADIRVAPNFSDYATSPLRAAVEPGDNNQSDFVVTHYPTKPRSSGSK
jgi:hypothetical protein